MFSKEFDKINIPIYICSPEWKVIYRNRACKKYTPSPRLNSNISRVFVDKSDIIFPKENEVKFVGCILNDGYKTALCFNYHWNAVLLFPVLLDYDILCSDIIRESQDSFAIELNEVFDYISSFNTENKDKFGIIEKIRNRIFASVDNYVAFTLFDSERRGGASFYNLYKFFSENIMKTFGKAGYKVETDYSGLQFFENNTYVDVVYFSTVYISILLFCLSVSYDRKCIVVGEHLGTTVRNTMKFTYKNGKLNGKENDGLKDFLQFNPIEYLNVMPFEEMCKSLGWQLGYNVSDEESFNVSVFFDIDVDSRAIFNSADEIEEVSPEKLFSDIVSSALRLFI